jgi:hypothetical protein
MYWMYSSVDLPSYDMLNGFERVPADFAVCRGALGFFVVAACWDEAFLVTGTLSAIRPGDASLRALDHESTSLRNWAFIASACRSASRSMSSGSSSGVGVAVLIDESSVTNGSSGPTRGPAEAQRRHAAFLNSATQPLRIPSGNRRQTVAAGEIQRVGSRILQPSGRSALAQAHRTQFITLVGFLALSIWWCQGYYARALWRRISTGAAMEDINLD